ncbi:hypothetical protein NL676_006252 [Syzygium grande]|nr:hypothetical protein NL676_006252 [Syzygium grande]
MTGGDGDVSPPAPPHAGTPISGFSAVPGSASSRYGRRSMKRGIEPALAGCSSAATLGFSLPPSKNLKVRGVGAEGGLKKSKKTEPDAPGMYMCCGKSFKNKYAVNGHMRIHKSKKTSETKGHGSTVADGGASSLVAEAQRKKIHLKLDLNKVPEDDDEEGA